MNCLNKITKTTLSLFVLSLIVAPAVFAANLIVNGDFSNGLTSWKVFTNGTVTFNNVNNAAEINVTSAGGNNQIYQNGFLLKANTQYTLSFDAKSTASGTNFNVFVHKHTADYDNYGLNETVSVTDQPQNYSYTFTTNNSTDTTDTRLRFSFNNSANGGVITIDNVVLEEGSTGGGGTTYDTYDFNEDGSVDLGDLVEIIKYVFGG